MIKLKITGMSCAACSSRVEKAITEVSGVTGCSVNLITGIALIEGNAERKDIEDAVIKSGYGTEEEKETKKEEPVKLSPMVKRVAFSGVLLIILMYFQGGHMINLPLPEIFLKNPLLLGALELVLALLISLINISFFKKGIKALLRGAPNMDTLISLGAAAAFIYSSFVLLKMSFLYVAGDITAAKEYIHEFYFESTAMILTLVTLGKALEERSKGKTTDALKELVKLSPETATVLISGKETKVKAEEVKKGDIFIVRAGDVIPVDGVVIKGEGTVNEATLTGESVPKDKEVNDKVWAATVNVSGYMECEALSVSEETVLSNIIKTVENAILTKAPIAKVADKVSLIFVPVVIFLAFLTTVVWLLLTKDTGFALARGISVLVISCPCALGLATPVAIMVGSGVGARNKILFKNAETLENLGKAKIVVLDKTGTVTEGKPTVTDIIPFNKMREEELLKWAYSLEIKSEHPLSLAIIREAEKRGVELYESENFKTFSGYGVSASVEGSLICGGNLKFISDKAFVDEKIKEKANELSKSGKTPMFFSKGNEIAGIIAVSDLVKEESADAINAIKEMGINVVMLTGDNKNTAKAIGKSLGITKIIAEVLPDEKGKVIEELKKKGNVVMVGDGINDAPALVKADTGIAIGSGADIAISSADVVIMRNNLSDVPAAIFLSRHTLKNIKQNLFWAFIYNVIGIPVAMGLFINKGLELSPMFGAAAMSFSSVFVVSNALRLNFLNIYRNFKKEDKKMVTVIKVEGMMCPHCEARVKKALEEMDGVLEAIPSHEKGTVTIAFEKDPDIDLVKKAIEDAGYNVIV